MYTIFEERKYGKHAVFKHAAKQSAQCQTIKKNLNYVLEVL